MRGRRSESSAQNIQSTQAPTVLSAGTRFVGTMESLEDLVLAGPFKGTLRTKRSLHIMPEAVFEGDIEAARVLILGKVQGSIIASERVELRTGAEITGDVHAPQIRVHEGVILNANVRMTGPDRSVRHYLLPTLLKSFEQNSNPEDMENVERAAESFLQELGFVMETRPLDPSNVSTIRPIYKSRDALAYKELRQRLSAAETLLQSAGHNKPEDSGSATVEEPLQTTGAAGAHELVSALARLRRAALMVGPVVVSRLAEGGALRIEMRPDSLPDTFAGEVPDPSHLLIGMQKVQGEVLSALTESLQTGVKG